MSGKCLHPRVLMKRSVLRRLTTSLVTWRSPQRMSAEQQVQVMGLLSAAEMLNLTAPGNLPLTVGPWCQNEGPDSCELSCDHHTCTRDMSTMMHTCKHTQNYINKCTSLKESDSSLLKSRRCITSGKVGNYYQKFEQFQYNEFIYGTNEGTHSLLWLKVIRTDVGPQMPSNPYWHSGN